MMIAMKVVVSALVVTAVTVISKQHPGIGGWIAALPIVSLLSATWLVAEHQPATEISTFLVSVLKGLVPTALLLVLVVTFLRKGWPFAGALGCAIVIWGASSFVLQRIGL
ncbi:hypothetical protein JI721_16435 [Alicyclobacillus cycloheptanicus]|uniref:Membrane protein (GlpM family) n=1 Tax=Alicyclobacillus cycloheptanicus TaxID=1457 RepID=A0ABT9XE15_9BACL|nr:hypothetical protein [Alicyclobacillus cycloheptanicus]MDQ0188533.1 putative membrane protein (GlpM family) [Alicyclobacillus cycloheptanicus]WDM01218.1 hypothetical protein JI721_16435 [Alicyclobacillus cycloheptanicus]